MTMKKLICVLALSLCFFTSCKKAPEEAASAETIPYWTENSPAMISIMDYVISVTSEKADTFVPEADRIAVFDFDGTLYGELFPTYFDNCLFMHRVLHDENYTAAEDVRAYAEAFEKAAQNHEPEPDSPRSTAQMEAETFAGMSVEEYRDYVRDFMNEPAYGFENMTYGEGFYLPMAALVEYLHDNGFKIFISSGSERAQVREVIEGVLDEWIPSENVIGSTFSLKALGQGDKQGRSYSFQADDQVLMEGNLVSKNQKTNKVFTIIDEIGKAPLLVFGNSAGDLSMAQYALNHGGRGYMLLCDDTERDYGNIETAESFRKDCEAMGLTTVSMKDEFETIYKEDAVKTGN